MASPKCPYCGGEMRYAFNGDIVGTHFLICETCLSRSPVVSFDDDPYAAAMKRDRAKGEWVYEEENDDWVCSVCGHDAYTEGDYRQVRTNFCPECGAEMEGEE